jgi:hypothetical protein
MERTRWCAQFEGEHLGLPLHKTIICIIMDRQFEKGFVSQRQKFTCKIQAFPDNIRIILQQVVEEPANPGDHGEPKEEGGDFSLFTILPFDRMMRESVLQPPARTS